MNKIFLSVFALYEAKKLLEKNKVDKETISDILRKIPSGEKLSDSENDICNKFVKGKQAITNSIKGYGEPELLLSISYLLESVENKDIEFCKSLAEFTKTDLEFIIPMLFRYYDKDYQLTSEEVEDTKEGGSTRTKGEFKPIYERKAREKHVYFAGRRLSYPELFPWLDLTPQPPSMTLKVEQEKQELAGQVKAASPINNGNLSKVIIEDSDGLEIEQIDLSETLPEGSYDDEGLGFEDNYGVEESEPVEEEEEEVLDIDDYDLSDVAMKP
jgi:hypothetical protein